MGMSSSQARLLSLTARQHDVEWRAQKLQAEKLQLASDSDRVYNTYLEALNSKKIQYLHIDDSSEIVYKDATLNALENGIVQQTDDTSREVLFMQSTQTGKIYVTKAVADKFGLTETGNETRTLDEFIQQTTGKTKSERPIYETQPNTNDIKGFTPVTSTKVADPVEKFEYTPVQNKTVNINDYLNSNGVIGISTAEDFELLLDHDELWNRDFVLQTDVDLTGVNWTGIGNESKAFTGNFNGNGHTISNLTMNTGTYGYGLFGFVEGGTIENIAIDNANVHSSAMVGNDSHVGALVGKATDATIKNCTVTNSSVSGNSDVALLVGHTAGNSTISNSYVSGTVNASIADVGGITGELAGTSTIKNCDSSANVTNTGTSYGYAGGIAGKISGTGSITNCHADGSITSNVSSTTHQVCGSPNISSVSESTAQSTWDSQVWNKGNPPTLKTQASEDYITVESLLSGAQNAIIIPPINSIASNMYYALDKAGIKGITESLITNWLNTNWGDNTAENNKVLASFNDYLNEYLSGNTDDDTFAKAIYDDVTNGTKTSTNNFGNKYASDTTITAQRGYDDQDCTKTDKSSKGKVEIPSINTIASNVYGAIKTVLGDTTITKAQVLNYLQAQYGTDNNENNIQLANINELINASSTNSDLITKSKLETLLSSIKNNTKYTNNDYYTSEDFNAIRNNTITQECQYKYGTHEVQVGTEQYWDTSDPDIANAMSMYVLAQRGIIILDEVLASSNEYLNNMIQNGNAVLTKFNPANVAELENLTQDELMNLTDDEYNKLLGIENVSIATCTNIIEVQDTTYLNVAEATYEKDMKKINQKETKIDTKLQKLEAERTSIKTEQDGLKKVIDDNVNLTFKLFS